MSLPRCLSRDFFSTLAESVGKANEQYFQEVHETPNPIKLLCLQQSCIADNKYLIETLDGSVPVEFKHTCLALVPPTIDGDRQLVGKVISFTQYKIAPTKSRYLIVLTRITIIPGDYRHLIGHLIPALVYHPKLAVPQDPQNIHDMKQEKLVMPSSGPIRKPQEQPRTVKAVSGPYDSSKGAGKKTDISPVKITDLTLYTPKWLIHARVVYKTEIRKFNNQRGESQLFSADLCDAHGEIRAIFFGEAVTKWYSFLEEGQVYSISGGQLKPANKRFNALKHSCEMILDENSHIQLFQNDDKIPSICCTFTPLNQLDDIKIGESIDVIGVVVKTNDSQSIQQKGTGNVIEKKDVFIVDSTRTTICLTLWGNKTQALNGKGSDSHPVICLKGVKVNSWQGKKLDAQGSTQITIEPVIPEALELRKWWTNVKGKRIIDSPFNELCTLSHIVSATNQALQFKCKFDTVLTLFLAIDSNGMVFTTRALIEILRDNSFSWPACPGCRKRMVNEGDRWNCTRCNSSSSPIHLYMLTLKIVDGTSHLWVTAFTGVGESIMNGVKAFEAVTLAEKGGVDANGRNFSNLFEEARLSEFVFKIKATVENFMDEPKIKYVSFPHINLNQSQKIIKATPLHRDIKFVINDRIKGIKKLMAS
ncbi:replication factor-A protein 1, putative [Theileria equi strain WA]|uniref:Replication protein A subunit n=1 Tax=Theileria equi strain WA TaxID=1537102 RepID=L0AUS4_THEEQ|nr:replication factor-A protein 1, putative [Theileria equi strain WA]AFZ78978.1 replication factor-A protein 1, putative [Theileria equi strain WA]|eukprot:XP_004828644.1 replication factor-A protein 1, putative [Theileria equi strain WA]